MNNYNDLINKIFKLMGKLNLYTQKVKEHDKQRILKELLNIKELINKTIESLEA